MHVGLSIGPGDNATNPPDASRATSPQCARCLEWPSRPRVGRSRDGDGTEAQPRAAAGLQPDPEQTTVQALDRALPILKVLAERRGHVADRARRGRRGRRRRRSTGCSRPSRRTASSRCSRRRSSGSSGRRRSASAAPFSGAPASSSRRAAVMHELMAETGETANLAIADGGQVVFISQVETHEPIRAFFRPGTRGPIHASGHRQGAARLSSGRGGGADRARAGAARPSRARTITDPARLAEELAAIRARGWAVDDEERTEGMRCIAAPIFNEFREAMAGRLDLRAGGADGAEPAAETSARGCAPPPTGSRGRSAGPRRDGGGRRLRSGRSRPPGRGRPPGGSAGCRRQWNWRAWSPGPTGGDALGHARGDEDAVAGAATRRGFRRRLSTQRRAPRRG